MKILKFFSGILTGVLFLEVVMRLVSPIIGPPQTVWQIQQQAKVIKIRERPADLGSIDLITFGDSTGKEGIDPDILDFSVGKGFHSFNASLNSSTTYTIMKQFQEILQYSKPKYVLILLGPGTSRDSDVDESVQTYDKAASAEMSSGIKGLLNRNFYLYRYRNNIRDPFILNTVYRSIRYQSLREGVIYRNVDTMKFNGDSSFARTLNSYASGNWELPKSEPTFKITNYPAATMRHLRIVQEECKKIGAKLVLSTVPTNSYNPKYRVLARSIGKQLGLDFIQGNNATTNLADFSDGVHLNAVGARKLSELIGTDLRAILRK
jgi:hypothetical protein